MPHSNGFLPHLFLLFLRLPFFLHFSLHPGSGRSEYSGYPHKHNESFHSQRTLHILCPATGLAVSRKFLWQSPLHTQFLPGILFPSSQSVSAYLPSQYRYHQNALLSLLQSSDHPSFPHNDPHISELQHILRFPDILQSDPVRF